MRIKLTLMIFLVLAINPGCEKEDEGLGESGFNVENTNVKTFETVSVVIPHRNLEDLYSGEFGEQNIQLNKFNDSTLVFVVPFLESGIYNLKTELGEIDFNVQKIAIPSSGEVIDNVFKSFDNEITTLANTSKDALDRITLFKKGVMEMYLSLTPEQKQEVAAIYAANKSSNNSLNISLLNGLDGPTTRRGSQSDCANNSENNMEFYTCSGDVLASITSKMHATILANRKLLIAGAGASAILLSNPATALVGLGIGSVTLAVAAYIAYTELLPKWEKLNAGITAYLNKPWVLTKNVFSKVNTKFTSNLDQSLNLEQRFETLKANDFGISNGISKFITNMQGISTIWYKISSVFGDLPVYNDFKESFEFEDNEVEVEVVDNVNVEVVKINGDKVRFKSTSGKDEEFTFKVSVNKEGFTHFENIEEVTVSGQETAFLERVSSFHQLGIGGQNLDAPIVVKVVNSNGDPMDNQKIKWEVTYGDGSLLLNESYTSSNGEAVNYWKIADSTYRTRTSACGRISQKVKAILLDENNNEVAEELFIADKGFVRLRFYTNFDCSQWPSGTASFTIGDYTHTMNLNPNDCNSYSSDLDFAISDLDKPLEGEMSFTTSEPYAYLTFEFYMDGGNISLSSEKIYNSTCSHMLYANQYNWKGEKFKITFSD